MISFKTSIQLLKQIEELAPKINESVEVLKNLSTNINNEFKKLRSLYPEIKKSNTTKRGKLPNLKKRLQIIEKQGPLHKHKQIYFKAIGTTSQKARQIINITTYKSKTPEPIRIAHLIGREL